MFNDTLIIREILIFMAQHPVDGHGLLIIEASQLHPVRHIRFGRIPLEEWSARDRELYMKTHNTCNRQTSMPPVGFEPTVPASQRPQTYALDRAATAVGCREYTASNNREIDKKRIRKGLLEGDLGPMVYYRENFVMEWGKPQF